MIRAYTFQRLGLYLSGYSFYSLFLGDEMLGVLYQRLQDTTSRLAPLRAIWPRALWPERPPPVLETRGRPLVGPASFCGTLICISRWS